MSLPSGLLVGSSVTFTDLSDLDELDGELSELEDALAEPDEQAGDEPAGGISEGPFGNDDFGSPPDDFDDPPEPEPPEQEPPEPEPSEPDFGGGEPPPPSNDDPGIDEPQQPEPQPQQPQPQPQQPRPQPQQPPPFGQSPQLPTPRPQPPRPRPQRPNTPPQLPQNRIPPRPIRHWTTQDIMREHGIQAGTRRFRFDEFEDDFEGADGAAFWRSVHEVSQEFGVNPGLLAVNALTENVRSLYLQTGGVRSTQVGLDYWNTVYPRLLRRVPGAEGLRGNLIVTDPGPPPVYRTFTNEKGVFTGRVRLLRNGYEALRALAAMLRYIELRLIDRVGGPLAWRQLGVSQRFLLIRYYLNAGSGVALRLADRAAAGEDLLEASGSAGPNHPQRTATIRAGQSIHVSKFFLEYLRYDR